jgi:hypothetical protein
MARTTSIRYRGASPPHPTGKRKAIQQPFKPPAAAKTPPPAGNSDDDDSDNDNDDDDVSSVRPCALSRPPIRPYLEKAGGVARGTSVPKSGCIAIASDGLLLPLCSSS